MISTPNLLQLIGNNIELMEMAARELLQEVEAFLDMNGCSIILTPIFSLWSHFQDCHQLSHPSVFGLRHIAIQNKKIKSLLRRPIPQRMHSDLSNLVDDTSWSLSL